MSLEDVLTDKATEEDLLEVPLSDKLFKGFFILVVVVGTFVMLRFLSIGVLSHDFYSARASRNMNDVRVEPASRGIITDRFDKPLIQNKSSFNAYLIPSKLPENIEDREGLISKISSLLNIEVSELKTKLSKHNWTVSSRVLLAEDITHDVLVSLSDENILGVEIDPTFKRVHEDSPVFSHLLGYTGLVEDGDLKTNANLVLDDQIGRAGLEGYYDEYIRGVNGEEVYVKTASGKTEEKISSQPPKEGARLKTFIDKDFQDYFYKSLEGALKNLGRDSGVGIAMNPQNGEVLAMVSIPGFDPTDLGSYLKRPHQPLFNRIVSGLYNPGSTIKPLDAVAALIEGIIKPTDQIFSPGYIDVPNPYDPSTPSRFLDWKPQGWVDLYSALARSSNVYFYEVGGGYENQKGLGIETLKSWWQKFGLSQKTNIDIIGEKSGFLPDPEWKEKATKIPWRLGDTYHVSIGQGDLSVTPIELLNYINAIAAKGVFYKPRIMKSITDQNGTMLKESSPEVLRDISSEVKVAVEEVELGMRDVVLKSYGTAHLLSDLPMQVAAKTGSAQVENNAKTNAFFVGYAPFENPKIAILVLVENAKEGSLNVVPVARDVLLWYYNNRLK